MSKIEENYIEYHLKIGDEQLKEETNLIGFNMTGLVLVQTFGLSKDEALFKGINEKNSKIYINNKELKPFSVWHKFPKPGTYKIKIEINVET